MSARTGWCTDVTGDPEATVVVTVYNDDGTVTCTTWHTSRDAALQQTGRLRAEVGPEQQSAIFPLDVLRAARSGIDWTHVVFTAGRPE